MNAPDPICTRAVALAERAYQEKLFQGQVPERFLFLSLFGSHLYGFPSPGSDLDIGGAHLLPIERVIGLTPAEPTYDFLGGSIEGLKLDCASHDLSKYLQLLIKKSGVILEQIFSPLVIYDGGHLEELRELARGAITKHICHHYLGFYKNQERLALKEQRPTAKALLYLFRVAMTGIHLLRSGRVQAHLPTLNDEHFKLPFLDALIARKREGGEAGLLDPKEVPERIAAARALEAQLQEAAKDSPLPDSVTNMAALNDFLIRLRLDR